MQGIQNYPAADSPPTDPFESLVSTYYQLKGYITSTNKWFWVQEQGKKQRGYQDIDVLAINGSETLIVSVTTNLDDKIRYNLGGSLRQDMLNDLNCYFDRVSSYLNSISSYKWLVEKTKKIKRIIVFSTGKSLAIKVRSELNSYNIELVSAEEIIEFLQKTITEYEEYGLKTNNLLIKTVQLILHGGEPTIKKRLVKKLQSGPIIQ